MNNIDADKIIPAFDDCKGTCKTPIGCTCGKMEEKIEPSDVRLTVVKHLSTIDLSKLAVDYKICNCGKNSGGACRCAKETQEKEKEKENTKTPSNTVYNTKRCCAGKNKLEVYNWLENMPAMIVDAKMVEVQFKNTRKSYYLNSNDIELCKGDIVAVEATPGHDIGEVTLTGKLVELQIKKNNFRGEIKRVYRVAKPNDIEKYELAKTKEHKTMLRARELAEEQQLNMKISDVEYQGDGNKAIFYYIADERVDFRELIKRYASEFKVKIEMKQIGARQEAGRVGGIGPCGRQLCCSSSMSNFVSVSTSAARLQDIPLNPQKLAGQCGKLKCCLNFEVDVYLEAQRTLPSKEVVLETQDSTYYHFKTDVLAGKMTYSTDKYFAANLVSLDKDRVHEVIQMNKRGSKPGKLQLIAEVTTVAEDTVKDILTDNSLNRFDTEDTKKKRNNRQRRQRDTNQNRNESATENTRPKQVRRPQRTQEGDKVLQPKTENPRTTNNANSGNRKNDNAATDQSAGNNRNRNRNNRRPNNPTGGASKPENNAVNPNNMRRSNNRHRPARGENNNNKSDAKD